MEKKTVKIYDYKLKNTRKEVANKLQSICEIPGEEMTADEHLKHLQDTVDEIKVDEI